MNIFRRLGALARSPNDFFRRIENVPVSDAILTYTIIILLSAVLTFPIAFWTAYASEGLSFSMWFVGGIVQTALSLAQQVVSIVISVLMVHGFARVLGGKGEFSSTVKALLYPGALIGLIFLFLSVIFGIVFGSAFTLGTDLALVILGIGGAAVGLVALGLAVWAILLVVKGLKVLHGLSTGRAVLAGFVLPLIVMIILGLILGATIISFLGGV